MSESKQCYPNDPKITSNLNEKAFANMINLSQSPNPPKRLKTEQNSTFLSPNKNNLLINQNSMAPTNPMGINCQIQKESSFKPNKSAFTNSSFGKKPTMKAGTNLISNMNSEIQPVTTAKTTVDSDSSLIKNSSTEFAPNPDKVKASMLFNQKTASTFSPANNLDLT